MNILYSPQARKQANEIRVRTVGRGSALRGRAPLFQRKFSAHDRVLDLQICIFCIIFAVWIVTKKQ